jgi:hypothetical protein
VPSQPLAEVRAATSDLLTMLSKRGASLRAANADGFFDGAERIGVLAHLALQVGLVVQRNGEIRGKYIQGWPLRAPGLSTRDRLIQTASTIDASASACGFRW